MIINKATIDYLAELARIKIKPEKEEKMLRDLERILEYFEELKSVDTEGVEPVTGGTTFVNVFRNNENGAASLSNESAVKSFPHRTADNYNKIPPVFE